MATGHGFRELSLLLVFIVIRTSLFPADTGNGRLNAPRSNAISFYVGNELNAVKFRSVNYKHLGKTKMAALLHGKKGGVYVAENTR